MLTKKLQHLGPPYQSSARGPHCGTCVPQVPRYVPPTMERDRRLWLQWVIIYGRPAQQDADIYIFVMFLLFFLA